MSGKILVIDDDKSIRIVLSAALTRNGYFVKSSATTAGLWGLLDTDDFDIMITDVGLPDGDTLDLLPKIQKQKPNMKIIVISAKTTLITAVRAEKKGAFFYLPKPFDLDEITGLVKKIFDSNKILKKEIILNKPDDHSLKPNIYDSGPIVGKSKAMQDTFRLIARLITSNITVLISGENGTGKKLVAKSIHDLTNQPDKKFIKLNINNFTKINKEIADFSNNLIKDFSYIADLINLDCGTIFIDQVCDGTLIEQYEFLNFIENHKFLYKSNNSNISNIRIIVSTKKNLIEMVENGQFREDLFYKLNIMPIHLPPLRDRIEDIPTLIDYFISFLSKNNNKKLIIDASNIEIFKEYNWPGNIQELRNIIERLFLISNGKKITKTDITNVLNDYQYQASNENTETTTFEEMIDEYIKKFFKTYNENKNKNVYDFFIKKIEKPLIDSMLNYTRGNQIKASNLLGFNRNTLRKKINQLGVTIRKVRKNDI